MEHVGPSPLDWLFPFVFVAVGLCCLVFAVISGVRTARFVKGSIETSGEVVRLQKAKGNIFYQRFGYAPVFRFRGADGRTHTVTSRFNTSPPTFQVGDLVQVRYEASDPNHARIATLLQTWGSAIVIGVAGVALIAFVVLVMCRSTR